MDVDNFAASIHRSLRARNLTDIVDVIFVSDHGMAETANHRLVYLDDIMGEDHVKQIEHEEGPSILTQVRIPTYQAFASWQDGPRPVFVCLPRQI